MSERDVSSEPVPVVEVCWHSQRDLVPCQLITHGSGIQTCRTAGCPLMPVPLMPLLVINSDGAT